MLGASEQTRRTRMRVSSVAAPAAGAAINPLGVLPDDMRRTRAASKRAAGDDGLKAASCSAVPAHQQPKKRAALADLSNQCNIPAPVLALAKASQQAVVLKDPLQAKALIESREPSVEESRSSPSHVADSVQDENAGPDGQSKPMEIEVEEIESKENVPKTEASVVALEKSSAHVQGNPPARFNAAAIASLERRTLQSLYISKDSKTDDACMEEATGWSEKLSYVDIDVDHQDPQMCSLYAPEIYQHLCVAELKRRPGINFMTSVQQDINPSMRGILVDWLVEVAEEYKLVPDTLYLTVNYIDRYLSGNIVNRQKLQLLGVACMLIASKYEEICAPQVEEFCYITDNTYSREEVLEMERRILNHLRFELTTPTAKSFLRRFLRAAHAGCKVTSLQMDFLGNFLTELTLVEYAFLRFPPSVIAASAVFLARLTLDSKTKPWNATLKHYTGYAPSQLKDCVHAIHELQLNTKNCTLPAIREKYRQHKFKCVATLAAPSSVPPEYFEQDDYNSPQETSQRSTLFG